MNGTGANVLIKFTGDTKDVDAKMTGLNKTMGSVTKGFVAGSLITKGLSTAFNMVSSSAGAAVKRIDTMNNFPKVMKNFGVSSDEAKKSIDRIDQSVRGLPTSLDSAVAGVQNIFMATKNLPEAENMFKAINDSAMVFAEGSTEAVNRFIYSYKQAMSSGKANAQDFNSMNDAIPGLMDKVASSMGITWSELKSGLSSGKISMDQFNTALKKLDTEGGAGMQSLEKAAKDATGGIQTAITNMKTAITRGLGNAFLALDEALQKSGLGSINEIISKIGDGFEKVLKSIVPLIPPMVKFAQVLIKLAPLWAPIVAGLVAYSGAMKVAGKVTEFTDKLAGLPGIFGKIGSSAQNGVDGIKNFASAHKGLSIGIGLAAVAIGGAIALYKKSGGDANKMAQIITQKVKKITVTITQIAQKLPQIISQVLPKILNAITTALPLIINAITTALPVVLNSVISALISAIPILVQGLVSVISALSSALPSLLPILIRGAITLVVSLASALPKIIVSLLKMLPKVISSVVSSLLKCLPQLVQGAIQLVLGIVKSLPVIIKSLIKQAPYIIKQLAIALVLAAVELVKTGVKLIKQLWNGFKSWIGNFGTNVKNFVKKIPGWLKSGLTKIGEIGLNIVKGIGHGITNGYNWIKNKIKEFVGNVTSFIKKVFKIGSPSRLMADEIGQWIPKGIAVGITANTGAIHKAMSNMQHEMSDAFGLSPTVTGTASTHFSPEVNVTVQNNMKTDPLGQVVNSVKTFSGGAKNDYNYGIGG